VSLCISFRSTLRPVSKEASGYFDSTFHSPAKLDSGFWRSLTESRPYIDKESAVQRHGWNDDYLKPRSPILFRSQSPQPQRKNRKMRRTLSVDNIISDLPAHIQKQAVKLSENDQKIFSIMISKANREEVDKRLQAAKELESAEERKVENELKRMKVKRHQMHLADRMRKSQELRVGQMSSPSTFHEFLFIASYLSMKFHEPSFGNQGDYLLSFFIKFS